MFERVLIANRGEIAVRIATTLHTLGIEAIGVFAPEDRDAHHRRALDRDVALEPRSSASPYLDVEQILANAVAMGAEAIHPGYGFLAERADAAAACRAAGLVWVGPPAEAIALLGDKVQAKRVAVEVGVPVVPGLERSDVDAAAVAAFAGEVGFPVLLKAAAGGGGKGMRRVDAVEEIDNALTAARREASAAFGRSELLVERLVEPARHIEVQVALDEHGAALALGERECSLQRRHQKLIEEAPAPALDDASRERLSQAAVALARAAGYRNLGTVEFLVDAADPQQFFFLELNARLQVEHPVTEAVTGLDLVELQLRIAAGAPLAITAVSPRGHAVEARVCAERPVAGGFLPATGRIVAYREPPPPARVDSGVAAGSEVTAAFDSLLLKVIAHGDDRAQALARLDRALSELSILGVETNIGFLRRLLADPDVRQGTMTTTLVERLPFGDAAEERAAAARAAAAVLRHELALTGGRQQPFDALDGWRQGDAAWTYWHWLDRDGDELELSARVTPAGLQVAIGDGEPTTIALAANGAEPVGWRHARDGAWLWLDAGAGAWAFRDAGERKGAGANFAGGLEAPLPGVVIALRAAPGTALTRGQPVVTIESMKMELDVVAPTDGRLVDLGVDVGDHVTRGQVLATVEATEDAA